MNDEAFDAAVQEAVSLADAEQKLSALERLRRSVLKERRLLRVLTVVAIVVGCVGIFLAVGARSVANEASAALDAFTASRTEARAIACQADNDTAGRINGLNDRTQDLLRDASAGGDRTPEEQERVDAFLVEQLAKYEALKVPLRDCSPQGIEDYYGGR